MSLRPDSRPSRPRYAVLGLLAVLVLARTIAGHLTGDGAGAPVGGDPIRTAGAQEGPAGGGETAGEPVGAAAEAPGSRYTEEQVRVLTELREQRRAFQDRKQQEEKTEERLQILRNKLVEDLDRFRRYRDQIQTGLNKEKEIRSEKMDHLVNVYANMNPEKAAERIDRMDRKTAVKLLSRMTGKSAGRILSFVSPDKANRISQDMTKMVEEIQ